MPETERETPIELIEIEPARSGWEGRGLLMVNGYLSRLSNAAAWARAYRARGYGGAIRALAWETGGPLARHIAETGLASVATAGTLGRLPGIARSIARLPGWGTAAAGGALFVGMAGSAALRHWREHAESADRVGSELAVTLAGERPEWAFEELRVAGFSLGARVVYACLSSAASELEREAGGGTRTTLSVDDVDLFGGALDGALEWDRPRRAVRGRITNYFSRSDWVLRGASRLLHPAPPIGLRATDDPAIEDVDLTDGVTLHWSYPEALQRLDA